MSGESLAPILWVSVAHHLVLWVSAPVESTFKGKTKLLVWGFEAEVNVHLCVFPQKEFLLLPPLSSLRRMALAQLIYQSTWGL